MIRAPMLLAVTLALAGCAGGPGEFEDEPSGPAMLISPSGEPFRPTASGPTPLQQWFAGADTNRDGILDRAEFRADALRVFRLVDANHNGEVRGLEIDRYERDIAPELLPSIARGGGPGASGPDGGAPDGGASPPADDIIRLPGRRGGPGGPEGGPGERRGPPPGGMGRQPVEFLLEDSQPIASADYDQSRGVTEAEFLQRTDARFAELDRSGSGRLRLSDLHPREPRRAPEPRSRQPEDDIPG